jgi:hypothetical protein
MDQMNSRVVRKRTRYERDPEENPEGEVLGERA